MNKYRAKLIMVISILGILLTACNKSKVEEVSDRRDTLVIGQSMAENIIHFGLTDRVLGVGYLDNSFSIYKDELEKLPILSQSWPSKESIMALDPKIIYSMHSAFKDEYIGTYDFWNGQGMKTLGVVNYDKGISKENYYGDLSQFGEVFEKEEEVKGYIDDLEGKIKILKDKNKDETAKDILFIGSTAGRDYYDFYPKDWCIVDEVIEDLGSNFISLSDKNMELSIEAIIKSNPDKIIITEFKNDDKESIINDLKSIPALSDLRAIKEDQILVVDYTSSIRGGLGLENLYNEVEEFLYGGGSKI